MLMYSKQGAFYVEEHSEPLPFESYYLSLSPYY